jgi:hypothetical protein
MKVVNDGTGRRKGAELLAVEGVVPKLKASSSGNARL